ncbi:MAG: hypothetical protein Q8Q42_02990 [Nanoarchaeota archaeon]|nr:hypothetical protein [Nanoarchaeota archaeon]
MDEGARTYVFENLKIKQSTLFDMTELYLHLFSWFEVMGFDFYEKNYEKWEMGTDDTLKIFWVATKKADDYSEFVIETNFFITGFKKVEIEREGMKIKTNTGTMEIRMSAYLIKDVGDKMKKAVGNLGRDIYEKFITRSRLEDHEVQLYTISHLLIDEIKGFMSMHKF